VLPDSYVPPELYAATDSAIDGHHIVTCGSVVLVPDTPVIEALVNGLEIEYTMRVVRDDGRSALLFPTRSGA
jgi:hypothetical protein